MQLKQNDIAPRIAEYLRGQQDHGMQWAVYDTESNITGTWDFTCFRRQLDAHAYVNAGFAEAYHQDVDTIPSLLKQLDETITYKYEPGMQPQKQKEENMNLNNLEEIKGYLTDLKFDPTHIKAVEENMAKGIPAFDIADQFIGESRGKTGVIDLSIPVRQSSQSENYYISKFDLTFAKAQPLPQGHRYIVASKDTDSGKDLKREFDSPAKAIDYLNGKTGHRELHVGPDLKNSAVLVRKEDDKLIYVNKDFRETYHSKPITQGFYLNEGQGFTLPQALNLIQGRSVYKDNLMTAAGEQYKAYVSINREDPLSTGTGFRYQQFRDPEYGFDVEKALKQYGIQGLDDPATKKELIGKLREGELVKVNMEQNGKQYKVAIEASPRFKNINIYSTSGESLKREFFDKTNAKAAELTGPKALKQRWDTNQKQGMRL